MKTSRFVRQTEAAGFVGVCVQTLKRMVKDGRMPEPTRLSPRVVGWRESQLESWLASREAARAVQPE
jgi:prophage regulatory protein